MSDRRTAALGVCLFTASRRRMLAVQQVSYWVARIAGARLIPGRVESWSAGTFDREWTSLLEQWRDAVGAFDGYAAYQRRQRFRDGLTLLLTREGSPRAVIKVRHDDGASLALEQRALAAVDSFGPRAFQSPKPLGMGEEGGASWSAQEAVFRRPHRPAMDVDPVLFDEVSRCLEAVLADEYPRPAGWTAAHRDLTPWNLRRDHNGRLWLYDWEDCGWAPEQADRTYHAATASALDSRDMPVDLPAPALAYWREIVLGRPTDNDQDAALTRALAHALSPQAP